MIGEGGHGLSIGSLGKGGSVADVQNVLSVPNSLTHLTGDTDENERIENVRMVRMFVNWIPMRIKLGCRRIHCTEHDLRVGQVGMASQESEFYESTHKYAGSY